VKAGIKRKPLLQERLKAAREAAEAFRERFMDEPEVVYYQSVNLVRVPYPTWYAYSGVYTQSTYKFPYLHILNRLFIVQFHNALGELKTLLFSPSDIKLNVPTIKSQSHRSYLCHYYRWLKLSGSHSRLTYYLRYLAEHSCAYHHDLVL